ncbi:oxidoreductase [Agaricicola taiwanensis]|uniref:Oxidoreductase n=1 Tax=Agaricicola taiwanensis TaxID=591372 RepID=A0A8J2VNX5_9RHOB|nr:aldo/keto reductase [Agaricicola taiwanensis]GGE34682.1 oxidoreductase [Agaricicola taiwanensis]
MDMRTLGSSGLQIAPIVLGGNVFGWTADEATSFQLLDAFVDAGFNAIDTADSYSRWAPGNRGGESETIIGKWLASSRKRDKVVLATKVGWDLGDGRKGLAKDYILEAVEGSLRRLKTDRIDLYQSHVDDHEAPMEETLWAYDQLIRQGKVRAIGASNHEAERLKTALSISERESLPRYESLQPKYNLYDRDAFEGDLENLCLEENVGVICYYGLAAGFLTGKYRSAADFGKSARGQGMSTYLNARGLRILAALDKVSGELGGTPAQVALAWLIARPSVTAPIVSATSLDQLRDILGAARLTLGSEAIAALDDASA